MSRFIDLTGRVFGRLTVLGHTGRPGKPRMSWKCQCVCGSEVTTFGIYLTTGETRSCGCLVADGARERWTTHGHSRTGSNQSPSLTYQSWFAMKQRCTNPNNKRWKEYGDRGITFCERWDQFTNFLEDMGERPKGMTLDRIDNDSDYSPSNCAWASANAQARNKRNTQFLMVNGRRLSFASACEEYGLNYQTMRQRQHRSGRRFTQADLETAQYKIVNT